MIYSPIGTYYNSALLEVV